MGMTPTDAATHGLAQRAAKALAIDDSIQARMDIAGLGEDVILKVFREELRANETRLLVVDKQVQRHTVVAHDIRLRTATTLAKIRGLLSDRNTVVNVGNALVAFPESGAPSWQPSPVRQQCTDSAPTPAVHSDSDTSNVPSSTLVGPLRRPGGLGHDRRNRRWQVKSKPNSKHAKRILKAQSHGKGGGPGGLHPRKSVPAKRRKVKRARTK